MRRKKWGGIWDLNPRQLESQSECYYKQLFTALVVTLYCSLQFLNYRTLA